MALKDFFESRYNDSSPKSELILPYLPVTIGIMKIYNSFMSAFTHQVHGLTEGLRGNLLQFDT